MIQAPLAGSPEDRLSERSLFTKSRYSDIFLMIFDGVGHVNFTSYCLFGIDRPVTAYWAALGPAAEENYRVVCRIILTFLDAALRNDEEARADLERIPVEYERGGVKFLLEKKKALPAPPSFEAFVNDILARGFERAAAVLEEHRGKYPDCGFYDDCCHSLTIDAFV